MFEQTIERPYVRRGLSKKGWAWMLLIYLAACIVLILWFHHRADVDEQVASRERVVTGTIINIQKGRNDSASYAFQFQGTTYEGTDDCDYLNLSDGKAAKVFLDPTHPTDSGLRSFEFKRNLHHGFMTILIYVSVFLAILASILWLQVIKLRQAKETNV